jgi:phage terminase small subunit
MLTQKQELFCITYIKIGNASESYRQAYNASNMKDVTINKRSSELMANGVIAGRINELRTPLINTMHYDVLSAMSEAGHALRLAAEMGNPSAMIAAVTLRAKLNGLFAEKKEIRTGLLDDIDTATLLAMRDELAARHAALLLKG